MKHKEDILRLYKEGKNYIQIRDILGCSLGTICYHCGKGQREKRLKFSKDLHPYTRKTYTFKAPTKKYSKRQSTESCNKLLPNKVKSFLSGNKMNNTKFTVEDVINKFGERPNCYLTGKPINIYEPRTYEFDHIIPRSRGGDNSIDNLGICTKSANQSKRNMTPDEYINLCKQVLEHNGYNVTKTENSVTPL